MIRFRFHESQLPHAPHSSLTFRIAFCLNSGLISFLFSLQHQTMSSSLIVFSNQKGFPQEFHISGKILTVEFLEASNEVIAALEKCGVLFIPLVLDMRRNANQLLAHYQKDETSRQFIEDMILSDEHRTTHTWLLWLKRALELIERFFWHVLNDTDVMTEINDDLRSHIGKAYDEVLKPFHGFLTRRSFEVL